MARATVKIRGGSAWLYVHDSFGKLYRYDNLLARDFTRLVEAGHQDVGALHMIEATGNRIEKDYGQLVEEAGDWL